MSYNSSDIKYVSDVDVWEILPKRRDEGQKGDYGKLLIVAGSNGMAGAAILAASGALRGGAGLVTVSIDEALFSTIHCGVPCATCVGRDIKSLDLSAYDAIAMGPGLGNNAATKELVAFALKKYAGPLVLDADALNVFAGNLTALSKTKAALIITPHPGEAARLLKISAEEVNANRAAAALRLANESGAIAVLKGSGTLVAAPNGDISENPTGNPGMATGGSGDVLTGLVAALAGQGIDPMKAAKAAVFLHGRAGDMAAKTYGEYGMIAADLPNYIAKAIINTADT